MKLSFSFFTSHLKIDTQRFPHRYSLLAVYTFLLFTMVGFLVGRMCDQFFVSQIKKFNERQKISVRLDVLAKMRRPIVTLAIGLVLMIGTPQMMLPIQPSLVLHFIYKTIISLSIVFLLSSIIDIICDIFTKKAGKTESKLDDQLIPLIRRASKPHFMAVRRHLCFAKSQYRGNRFTCI